VYLCDQYKRRSVLQRHQSLALGRLDWLVEGAGLGHLQGSNTRALAGPIAFHLGAEPRMLQQGGRTMHVARFTPAGFS